MTSQSASCAHAAGSGSVFGIGGGKTDAPRAMTGVLVVVDALTVVAVGADVSVALHPTMMTAKPASALTSMFAILAGASVARSRTDCVLGARVWFTEHRGFEAHGLHSMPA